jgi:hypothetical protein
MTHPLVEQLRSARSEWRRALRGIPEADGLPEIAMRPRSRSRSSGYVRVKPWGWLGRTSILMQPQHRSATS